VSAAPDAQLRLPTERAGRAPPEGLVQRRQGMAAAAAAGTWRTDPPPELLDLGVRALRWRSPAPPRGVVLHFHGGGYRLGLPEMTGPFAVALAARCGVDVVCPQYRLAPEHPFPAGLNDARTALTALQATTTAPIILSGDSAGGGLAAALAALARSDARPPAGLVTLSAWLDVTVSSPCYDANAATDPLFSRASAEEAAELYLQGASAHHPLASPALGDVAGFPPAFVSVGEGEVLADDARRFHAALQAAGVSAELCAIPGMEHTAVARSFELTGAAETFEALTAFVGRVLG
jgi:acetyl esterase/lipase